MRSWRGVGVGEHEVKCPDCGSTDIEITNEGTWGSCLCGCDFQIGTALNTN